MVPWVYGGFYIHNPTLHRYCILHSMVPIYILVLLGIHLVYIHSLGTSSSTSIGSNSRIYFHTWVTSKDTVVLVVWLLAGSIQVYQGLILIAHPDNTLEVSILLTPIHILPEWYFLEYYTILKSIPSSTSGFLVMISLVVGITEYGEPYSTSTQGKGLLGYTGRYGSIVLFTTLVVVLVWIGVQLPQGRYLSYGRVYIMSTLSYPSTSIYTP